MSIVAFITIFNAIVDAFNTSKRSYKKESIYVRDLYTLTYEDGQTLESIEHVSMMEFNAVFNAIFNVLNIKMVVQEGEYLRP